MHTKLIGAGSCRFCIHFDDTQVNDISAACTVMHSVLGFDAGVGRLIHRLDWSCERPCTISDVDEDVLMIG